jgi:SAM-dependent methyltransferase
VFPKNKTDVITSGSLELFLCQECDLIQLSESYDLNEMYGVNYGYRSGLNLSMVNHLQKLVKDLMIIQPIVSGDLVLDIGSNDGTLLSAYGGGSSIYRIGIDPTGKKFEKYYDKGAQLIADFFSAVEFKKLFGNKKAKIITSISMFYDLESPVDFVKDIAEILDKEGIWYLEQSYMPTMLEMNSYDTICHEHVEYYSLKVLKKLFENQNLKIIDVSLNSINGGSFAITVVHKDSSFKVKVKEIDQVLERENRMQLNTLKPYKEFKDRVYKHREDLTSLIRSLNLKGKKVAGYGASTKGNVLLQFCGFTESDIACIAEVNEDKFGSYTPGSLIPILSESQVMSMNPDYLLVLPWHFKDTIIMKNQKFLADGGKFIFPLPDIEIV